MKHIRPLLVLFASLLVTFAFAADLASKPNVVYIMADELGYFDPSFMGNPNIRTPNIDLLCYFPDLLPTIAEVTGAKVPADIDGISILPELIGAEAAGRKQPQHEYLYWEISGQTAVRMGSWKAIQPKQNAPWELYDLAIDISSVTDLSAARPEILKRMQAYAIAAHKPAVEGTFTSTELHERDRAAKFGGKSPAPKAKKNANAKGNAQSRSMPTKGMFFVSNDPNEFGSPFAKSAFAKSKEPQQFDGKPTHARFVLLRATSEHSPNSFATVAELGVIGE